LSNESNRIKSQIADYYRDLLEREPDNEGLEFHVKISIDEIIEINRVADIREILKRHNVDVQ